MKKISHLIVIAVLAVFVIFPAKGSAKTYVYPCTDGGSVTTFADIVPAGPFAVGVRPKFDAIGQISSTCTTRQVSLTAENKQDASSTFSFDPLATLIPQTIVDPGQTFPLIPAQASFTAPATAGQYLVHFETGVEDDVPPQIRSFGGVSEFQNFAAAGGVGTPFTPGFSFWIGQVCLTSAPTQDETIKVGWTSSNGNQYSTALTVKAGETCEPASSVLVQSIIIPGPSTGTAGLATNFCARAENPSIHVSGTVKECPPNQPSAFLQAIPQSVHEGEATDLIWNSSYATSCTSPDFDTGGLPNGTVSSGPLLPVFGQANGNSGYEINYALTCTGPGGSTSTSTTVRLCHDDPLSGQCVF